MNQLLIPTKIIKSKRNSISLIIKSDGDFVVRAPLKCSDNKILKFINEKAEWIIKKRTMQRNDALKTLTFLKPEMISILGINYNIKIEPSVRTKIFDNNLLVSNTNTKQKVIKFLKRTALDYVKKRISIFANAYDFKYGKVSISSAKTCWGSCGYNNNLHFTYKLIMCPVEVVDYIIVHELCHTKIKNHSKNFWDLVYYVYPNYKNCEKWLKENRGIVNII